MKNLIFYLFLCGFVMVGCDPYRRINMRNLGNTEASIVFELKEDSATHSVFSISNDTKVQIRLLPQKPHNLAKMSFGSGKWTEAYIKSLADDLQSITILHGSDSLALQSESAIWNYLMDRRKGFGKKRIELIFE